VRLELTTYRLTAGRAANCAIQDQMEIAHRCVLSCILGRVVKALDLSPSGHSPREFEPRRMQMMFFGPSRFHKAGLLSLVVEHSLCKRKVGGSIPPVGLEMFFFSICFQNKTKKRSTSQRFELWRAEPNRFLIYLLNHSDTMS
jgi:hypothetical protein